MEPMINVYIDIIASLLKRVKISQINFLGIELNLENENTQSIDDRLVKLEQAKQNLKDGLSAIAELEKEATRNKKEVEHFFEEIKNLKENKANLEEEVAYTKEIISTDISTFQRIAKIPTRKQIKRERVIGFISGVVASVLASGIIWIAVKAYRYFF